MTTFESGEALSASKLNELSGQISANAPIGGVGISANRFPNGTIVSLKNEPNNTIGAFIGTAQSLNSDGSLNVKPMKPFPQFESVSVSVPLVNTRFYTDGRRVVCVRLKTLALVEDDSTETEVSE